MGLDQEISRRLGTILWKDGSESPYTEEMFWYRKNWDLHRYMEEMGYKDNGDTMLLTEEIVMGVLEKGLYGEHRKDWSDMLYGMRNRAEEYAYYASW